MKATTSTATVTLFRLAIARARRPQDHAKRLADAVEHLEGWANAAVRTHYDGEEATWMLVSPYRPVRFKAAKDIGTTCPRYVAGSFKVLGD
jgi:hypothetical protein